MMFNDWIKSKGEEVDSRIVLKYLKRKKSERAKEVIKEIKNALKEYGYKWMYIPSEVYNDEYYSF